MDNPTPETSESGLVVVGLRKAFYRDNSRKLVFFLMLCLIVITVQTIGLLYVITHPPKPQYFATTIDGRIQPLVPLDRPNLTPSALLQWANTAAIAAYTYNFVNYRQALQEASNYFTADGWASFIAALQSSNNLNAVESKKLIVSSVATGAPVILQQGLLNDVYAWKIQMPMLVTYQSASEYSQQSVVVTMLVVRISTLDSPKGVGIAQFVVSSEGTGTNNNQFQS